MLITLNNLITAAMLAEGEISCERDNGHTLIVPLSRSKWSFLKRYIEEQASHSLTYSSIDEELIIAQKSLEEAYKLWYVENNKVFTKKLNNPLLTEECIILLIALFGSRKIESISFNTTIKKDYLLSLCHSLSTVLNTPILPGHSAIKIIDIKHVIPAIIQTQPYYYSTELFKYVTISELKKSN